MKKHNALKIVVITLLLFVLLTWILPCATYQTEYTEIGRYQVGLFDLLSYQSTVFGYLVMLLYLFSSRWILWSSI